MIAMTLFTSSRSRSVLGLISLFLCVVLLSGCSKKAPEHTAVFYLEKEYPTDQTAEYSAAELLQMSGNNPVILDKEIEDIDLVRVDTGVCMLFHLSPSATMRLTHTTANNMGKRLILVVDGEAIGVRLIDEIIQNGQLFTFTELSMQEMGQIVVQLKQSRNITIPGSSKTSSGTARR